MRTLTRPWLSRFVSWGSPFMDKLGGYTSDHTARMVEINLLDADNKKILQSNGEPVEPLRGMTWNLQDKCHSKADHAQGLFANNPFDATETDGQYLSRKTQQMEGQLLPDLQEHKPAYVTLQEADLFTSERPSPEILALRERTRKQLRDAGYEIITSPLAKDQQPVVIIYRRDRLTPVSNSGRGEFPTPVGPGGKFTKNRGFGVLFTDQQSGKPVEVISAHLSFDGDYREAILKHQQQMAEQGITSIISGDTNHAPNIDSVGAIGSWNRATNVSFDAASGRLTVEDPRHGSGPVDKVYDVTFTSPPQGFKVQITELPGLEMKVSPDGKSAFVEPFIPDPQHSNHMSLLGRPWRRGAVVWKEINDAMPPQGQPIPNPIKAQIFGLISLNPQILTRKPADYPNIHAFLQSNDPDARAFRDKSKSPAQLEREIYAKAPAQQPIVPQHFFGASPSPYSSSPPYASPAAGFAPPPSPPRSRSPSPTRPMQVSFTQAGPRIDVEFTNVPSELMQRIQHTPGSDKLFQVQPPSTVKIATGQVRQTRGSNEVMISHTGNSAVDDLLTNLMPNLTAISPGAAIKQSANKQYTNHYFPVDVLGKNFTLTRGSSPTRGHRSHSGGRSY